MMRKCLSVLSAVVLAGITPAAAQSEESPKLRLSTLVTNFENYLKVILFGNATKTEARLKTVVEKQKGTAISEEDFTIALKAFDDKNCTATIVNERDTPGDAKTKETVVVDFKA